MLIDTLDSLQNPMEEGRNLTSAELRAAAERREQAAAAASGVADPSAPTTRSGTMEVAHVLYLDIVGYTMLRTNQQAAAQIEMKDLVNASPEVQQAKSERRFLVRPSGDGMALLFFRDIASPVRTALQIHEQMHRAAGVIQSRVGAPLKMRMGIHSGVVMMMEDMNAQSDAAGEGVNIAQRVMDCGDADHILLSGKVAESLLSVDPWQHYLRDLGDCRVKHGQVIRIYLLHGRLSGGYHGNVAMPTRVAAEQADMERDARRYRGSYFETHPGMRGRLTAFAVLAMFGASGYYAWNKVPAFKQTVLAMYAGLEQKIKPGAAKPTPAASGHKKTHADTTTEPRAPHLLYATNTANTANTANAANATGHPAIHSRDADPYAAPARVQVPDLLGRDIDDATNAAGSQGLLIAKNPGRGYDTEYGEGLIYRQSPEAGTTIRQGAHITVEISEGDPPDADAAGVTP